MTRSPVGGAAERPFAHLAEYLIALRRAARLPQRALARAANVSRGTVQRAESGTAPPSLAVLDAYVRACSGSPADHARARLLRTRGRTAQRDRLRHLDAPAPPLIPTEDDLGAALAAAYERAGAPSLSDARLTPGRSPLPHTTAWRIVKRRKLPPTAEQLVTFLTACGISPAEQRPYIDAYHRITADRGTRPLPRPAAGPGVFSASRCPTAEPTGRPPSPTRSARPSRTCSPSCHPKTSRPSSPLAPPACSRNADGSTAPPPPSPSGWPPRPSSATASTPPGTVASTSSRAPPTVTRRSTRSSTISAVPDRRPSRPRPPPLPRLARPSSVSRSSKVVTSGVERAGKRDRSKHPGCHRRSIRLVTHAHFCLSPRPARR